MRYSENPRSFKTKHWSDLWRSNIDNLETLNRHSTTSGFVAIDAEPWGSSHDFTQISIAFVPRIGMQQDPPKPIASLCDLYPIHSHCNYPCFWQGTRSAQSQKFLLRKNRICGARRGFQRVNPINSRTQLVLVRQTYKKTSSNPSWIRLGLRVPHDIENMPRDHSIHHLLDRGAGACQRHIVSLYRQPSMRDSLLAFGLGNDTQTVLPIYAKHSAGTDVLHILVVPANLLAFPRDTTFQVDQVSLRKFSRSRAAQRCMANEMFFRGRPVPREFSPFLARISMSGSPPILTAQKVYRSFVEYKPIAVGDLKQKAPRLGLPSEF